MDAMSLHIEPGSTEPIYRQIVGQISRMVTGGQYPPGTRMPSVRDVAAAHTVNPMTVSKAYALLEAQGFLERQRGKAMVVADRGGLARPMADRIEALAPAIRELARQAQELGLPADVVADALRRLMKEEETAR